MASNIVSTTIDETYPVAGVDNDSQGFRDNFQIIKDNFAAAKSEVEDLQDNVARTDTDNNHLGNKIISAELDQKIIEIDKNFDAAYNNRGILKREIIDFEKILKLEHLLFLGLFHLE
jgi:hypothetical protein